MQTLRRWRTSMCFTEDKLNFNKKRKQLDLMVSSGGHRLARLELVGTWKDDCTVMLVKDDKSIFIRKGVMKIHKILNHKSKAQMIHACQEAGKLTDEVRKLTDYVAEKSDVCRKNARSKSKLSVAV